MPEIKHTPGPWFVGEMHGYAGGTLILRRPAADYGPQGVIGDAPIAIVVDKASHWTNSYPVKANADLIAAAPDLLQVAKDLFHIATHNNVPMERQLEIAERATKVIAEAEGR
jgi:hypothetical protein